MRFVPLAAFLSLFLSLVAGCGKKPPAIKGPAERPVARSSTTETPAKTESDKPQDGHKNILVLTPRAAAKVLQIMKDNEVQGFLRARVVNGAYKLDIDLTTDQAKDYLGESRGVRIAVDRKSAQSLPVGMRVDYLDEGGQKGFKFLPPEGGLEPADPSVTLKQARRGFKTLPHPSRPGTPPPEPPAGVLRLVRYQVPVGELSAYLTPDPKDGKKHPAIVWITGGDCNTIDQGCWREGPAANDQSASAYRKAGIVTLYPSLRGGNNNPGVKEGFLGEVEDVLAAADFLRKQAFVDPDRIYLGGHSTGGTLVLLTAEYTDRFRAIFSFGPVENVLGYGPQYCPFDLSDMKEVRLRSPAFWLHAIRSPTFVFEGAVDGNADSLRNMARASKNPKAHFLEVKGANHFNVLAPLNRLIAQKILGDTAAECKLTFSAEEVNKPFQK